MAITHAFALHRFTAQAVNLVGHDDAMPDLYVPVKSPIGS